MDNFGVTTKNEYSWTGSEPVEEAIAVMVMICTKTKDNGRESREEEWTLARNVYLVDGMGLCSWLDMRWVTKQRVRLALFDEIGNADILVGVIMSLVWDMLTLMYW